MRFSSSQSFVNFFHNDKTYLPLFPLNISPCGKTPARVSVLTWCRACEGCDGGVLWGGEVCLPLWSKICCCFEGAESSENMWKYNTYRLEYLFANCGFNCLIRMKTVQARHGNLWNVIITSNVAFRWKTSVVLYFIVAFCNNNLVTLCTILA